MLAMLNDTDFVKYVAETYSYLVAEAVRKLEGMSVEQYLALVKKHYGDGVMGDLLTALSGDLMFTKKFVLNEHHLYGSSRLGVKTHKRVLLRKEFSISGFAEGGEYIVDEVTDSFAYVASSEYFCRVLAQKQYELTNHLGNVLATVLDRKTGVFDPWEDTLRFYEADVVSAKVYYPFGSAMLTYSNAEFSYAYGQNGQEKEDEIFEGAYSAEYWIYDSRYGRRGNTDPVVKEYESPYSCFGNSPIRVIDIDGADSIFYNQDGTESHRVIMEGDHTYWLKHNNGNITIGSDCYYKGFSYYSFFGDADKFGEPTIFTEVDRNSFPDTKKETIDNLVNQRYDGESYSSIWINSGPGGQFDYKNWEYFNENKKTDMGASNITTAYLIDGVLYNRNEMGMILWGATMGKTDIGYTGLYLDNKVAHLIIEGNNDELNEMNAWRLGFLIMRESKNPYKYHNTFMYGMLGIYYSQKVQGVDPTNKKGIFYDKWNEIR